MHIYTSGIRIRQITNWLIHLDVEGLPRLFGQVVMSDTERPLDSGTNTRVTTTSPVIKIVDKVATTESGSTYYLLETNTRFERWMQENQLNLNDLDTIVKKLG